MSVMILHSLHLQPSVPSPDLHSRLLAVLVLVTAVVFIGTVNNPSDDKTGGRAPSVHVFNADDDWDVPRAG